MESGTNENLYCIWGLSETDIYAGGTAGTLLHDNGTAWVSLLPGYGGTIKAIWGSSSQRIFLAGNDGIWNFDGVTWNRMDTGADTDFIAIWGTSSDNVFAITENEGKIWHYDGFIWSKMFLPYGIDTSRYSAVWGDSPETMYAAGDNIICYDGVTWKYVFADSKASLQLKAVRGDTESSLYTVGDKGMIVQYSDGVWQILNSGIESHFSGVWVSPDSQVFVIAEETGKGTIYLFPRD